MYILYLNFSIRIKMDSSFHLDHKTIFINRNFIPSDIRDRDLNNSVIYSQIVSSSRIKNIRLHILKIWDVVLFQLITMIKSTV